MFYAVLLKENGDLGMEMLHELKLVIVPHLNEIL